MVPLKAVDFFCDWKNWGIGMVLDFSDMPTMFGIQIGPFALSIQKFAYWRLK